MPGRSRWIDKVSRVLIFYGLISFFVIVFVLLTSIQGNARIEKVVAVDETETAYHYDYEELLDSYALSVLNGSDSLYNHFKSKQVVALGNSSKYYDLKSIEMFFEQVSGYNRLFSIRDYARSSKAKQATLPSALLNVSSGNDNGEIVTRQIVIGQAEAAGASEGEPVSVDDNNILIAGKSSVPMSVAVQWAEKKGAAQRFIDIASLYWQFGSLTGIRPEVLYAQSAYETNYGRFTGLVSPAHNNWAGIKIANPEGDRPEDHERFSTPEEGVRAHFNHIAAYVGIKALGEPHGRYHVVNSLDWAGTVKTVEELSGKWAPSSTYHVRIVEMIKEMKELSS